MDSLATKSERYREFERLQQSEYERTGFILVQSNELKEYIEHCQLRTWLFDYFSAPIINPEDILNALLFDTQETGEVYKSYPPEIEKFQPYCFTCKSEIGSSYPSYRCLLCNEWKISRAIQAQLLSRFSQAIKVCCQSVAVASPLHISHYKLSQPFLQRELRLHSHANQRSESNISFIQIENFSDV